MAGAIGGRCDDVGRGGWGGGGGGGGEGARGGGGDGQGWPASRIPPHPPRPTPHGLRRALRRGGGLPPLPGDGGAAARAEPSERVARCAGALRRGGPRAAGRGADGDS